ncbi:MAG: hypothetical protein ACTSX6_11940 [Candidatus Heimdallarchaeaceae archaeon]
MSEQFYDTLELVYSPKDIVDIMNEFNSLFQSLNKKIKQFSYTQDTFLGELKRTLKVDIGFLSPQKKNMVISLYGIIVTEDVVKKYDPHHFAEDISVLLEATGKKQLCTDDEFTGLLTSFFITLKKVNSATKIILRNFIELKGMALDNDIVMMILNQRNWLKLVKEINSCFEIGEFILDKRFISAVISHFLEKELIETKVIDRFFSSAKIYHTLINNYPPCQEEECLFDLVNKTIIEPYYHKLVSAFEKKIEERKEKLQEQFEIARKEFQLPVQAQKDQSKIEQILAAVEQPMYETLKLGRKIDEKRRQNIERNIEIALRRMAIEEFGVQDIKEPQKYLDYLFNTWFQIFEEYPQMALPLIDIKKYALFVSEPRKYISENKESIQQQLRFKLRRYSGIGRLNPKILAHAFSMIIFELISNPTVLSLSFDE